MQLVLRLGKLLGQGKEVPRGLVQEIARETDLERHCVSSLVRGEAKYISLETLGRICEYMAQKCKVDARTLATELFAYLPDEFWTMLAECERLQFCLGKRHVPNWPGKDYVMASDSYLQGELFSQISDPSLRRVAAGNVPAPHFSPPHLLLSEGEQQLGKEVQLSQKVIEEARQLMANCRQQAGSGLIVVGSMKVNTLAEVLCAEWFNTEPGVPQDKLANPKQRSVPFFVCYRDEDVQPPSCCGGTRLSKRQSRNAPGIYFEGEHGKWNHCACDDEYRDAAFLMYTYRPLMKQVELACGGFSGEATAALAAGLNRIVTGIKPQYISPTLRIGMYIVEFKFQNAKRDREELNGNGEFDIKLLPVGTSALERRLPPTETPSPQRRPSEVKSGATGTIGRPRSARPK